MCEVEVCEGRGAHVYMLKAYHHGWGDVRDVTGDGGDAGWNGRAGGGCGGEGGVDAGSGRLVDEIRGLEGGVKLSREVGRQARIQHDESNEQAHT